jgi:cation diffusion facilitator CzcD-associated flavoprotein CzcO
VQRQLGVDYDVATHFTPRYAPWDQRLCIAADADLFRAIRAGRLEVVTDTVERFTAEGLRLASGKTLAADIVVTATGLELEPFNGVVIRVDGHAIEPGKALGYKGLMYEGVPNLAVTFGYTNASWTLRADLCAAYVCRLLAHMRRTGARVCTPRNRDLAMSTRPWIDFTSGYVRRGSERFPKQGDRDPWRAHQSYFKDLVALRFSPVEDGVLEFSDPARAAASARKVRKVIE